MRAEVFYQTFAKPHWQARPRSRFHKTVDHFMLQRSFQCITAAKNGSWLQIDSGASRARGNPTGLSCSVSE
jgi:hypothetical protein